MIVAVDPGVSGAIALNDWRCGRLEVIPMPIQHRYIAGRKLRTVIDEGEVLSTMQAFASMGATHLFIEAVQGLPGQSAPAAFAFGQGYGTVRVAGMAAGLIIEAVPPAVWKAAMRVPKDKHAARQRASEMIPTHRHLWSMAKDDGLAEAALLSIYGQRWVCGEVKRSQKDVDDIARAAAARAESDAHKRQKREANQARIAAERSKAPEA